MIGDNQNEAAANHNRVAWNQMARQQQRFTRAAPDEGFDDPLKYLDGDGWLSPGIRGLRLLCLAAGGGRHGPLYAAAGADVTVVDLSSLQLELDRLVAAERKLTLRTVETSMDDLSMFGQGEFDVVVHPVSTCYLPDLRPVYAQIARVTRPDGLYISQHKQPTSLQVGLVEQWGSYRLEEPYYRTGPLPPVEGSLYREAGTLEYLHRWEQLLGQMCRAGFVIEDLCEPCHADPRATSNQFGHRSRFVAPYVRVKARRRSNSPSQISDARAPGSGTTWNVKLSMAK
jgi:SAM-dependent methyltransferase